MHPTSGFLHEEEGFRESNFVETRINKKGKSYDLHKLIQRLQHPCVDAPGIKGLSEEEIGLVYAAMALTQPKENYPSFSHNQDNAVTRAIKKRFQEATRIGFYQVILNIEVEEKPFGELRDLFTQKVARGLNSPSLSFLEGTLEYTLFRALGSEATPSFARLSLPLRQGAEQYHRESISLQQGVRKFLEYDYLVQHFRGLLQ